MGDRKNRSGGLIAAGAILLCAAAVWGVSKMNSAAEIIPAETNAQRIEYINQCGWQTGITHTDVTEIRIPANFDEVYEEYNRLQLKQGFDLRPFRAHSVKKYTYNISNYTSEGSAVPLPDICANLLVEDGKVIGADITSGEAGSFTAALFHEE